MIDFAIVLRMREVDKLGWSRMAAEYRKLTGQYVSRDTIKRRYLMAKAKQRNPAIEYVRQKDEQNISRD